ncbi:MAG: radical SAM protein [Candidatus Absconditabacteria bacterium]
MINKGSLQILIPSMCLNNCIFCISRLNKTNGNYENKLGNNFDNAEYVQSYINQIKKAINEGYNNIIITSDGEPILNIRFLKFLGKIFEENKIQYNDFEIQTSGVGLKQKHLDLLKSIGIKLISISLSNIFDNKLNAFYNQTKQGYEINIDKICAGLIENGFKLRLSLNMTNSYNNILTDKIIQRAMDLGANQLTFRRLYPGDNNSEDYKNILNNSVKQSKEREIIQYLHDNCNEKYMINQSEKLYYKGNLSILYITDCMAQNSDRYRILKPDCKLYKSWEQDAKPIY